jgi:hypothetical protein
MPERIFKSEPTASAGIAFGSECARMHGTDGNYIQTDSMGTFISGKVSFLSQMPEIRTGALWTFNSNWAMMIPSTLGTPSAVLVVDPPVKNVEALVKQSATIMAGLGMLTSITS